MADIAEQNRSLVLVHAEPLDCLINLLDCGVLQMQDIPPQLLEQTLCLFPLLMNLAEVPPTVLSE